MVIILNNVLFLFFTNKEKRGEKVKKIILIIPAYNESESLKYLIERLDKVTLSIPKYKFNYLFVNDGSTDNTLSLLKEISEYHSLVSYVDLSLTAYTSSKPSSHCLIISCIISGGC